MSYNCEECTEKCGFVFFFFNPADKILLVVCGVIYIYNFTVAHW